MIYSIISPLYLIINVLLTASSESFDNVKSYNGKPCTTPWLLKSYESLHTFAPFDDSSYCFQADVNSCVKISPINFIPGNIEATVYFELFSNKSNLIITALNEKDIPIVNCEVNRLIDEYINGWHTLLLTIDHNFTGYVKIESTCVKGDIILVDSIRYITNGTTKKFKILSEPFEMLKLDMAMKSTKLKKELNLHIKKTSDRHIVSVTKLAINSETILAHQTDTSEENTSQAKPTTKFDSTTSNETTFIEETREKQTLQNLRDINTVQKTQYETQTAARLYKDLKADEFEFWNPWTITLISVGIFVVISITAVTAYYLGKNKSQEKSVFVIDEEMQPPRMIPRVTQLHNHSFRV